MSPQDADAALVQQIERIAWGAGALILTYYDQPIAARAKVDGSPVTAADEAANEYITAALAALTPQVPIVAEESVFELPTDAALARAAEAFWLVDPLDGTKEFIGKNGEFTVNIALVRQGLPVLGVVFAPALGETYTGLGSSDGGRAYRQVGSERVPIRVRQRPAGGPVIVVSRSHRSPETQDYLARFPAYREAERGSSLKFCLVAAGEADLYPRLGRTMEWDTAAGQGVLQAAGGSVCDLAGQPLRYGKPGFENPSFVASGC